MVAPDPAQSTATLEEARAHARAQAGATAVTAHTVPAAAATDLPAGVEPADVVWDETVGAGGYAGRWLGRDTVLRISDLHGDASVALTVHNAGLPVDRLNVADTVKVQWQAYLGPGAVLLSGMGRALMTVVADTSARHDALCGGSHGAGNQDRYGGSGVHSPTPSARDLLVVAAAKHGLSRRDLPPAVNLFKGVRVGDDGSLRYDGAPTGPTAIDLRAEMDVLVLVASAPHPLDDRPDYTATTVRCTAWRARRPDDDPFRTSSPERTRAYLNTEDFLSGRAR